MISFLVIYFDYFLNDIKFLVKKKKKKNPETIEKLKKILISYLCQQDQNILFAKCFKISFRPKDFRKRFE